ncbi:hypothetical protein [Streptomyces sp. SID2888]|nr:hypothetical protein [Streptomyces sp. SID2888]
MRSIVRPVSLSRTAGSLRSLSASARTSARTAADPAGSAAARK